MTSLGSHLSFYFLFFFILKKEKLQTIEHLKAICMGIYIEKGLHIVQIMNDKGVEFDNIEIDCFCEAK